jgi:hypothetical protein
LVVIEATITLPCALESARVAATSNIPSNSVKVPPTVAIPMCLTANSTLECVGSTAHLPEGTTGVVRTVAVWLDMLPRIRSIVRRTLRKL